MQRLSKSAKPAIEIKMQNMVLVGRKQLAQESSLRETISMFGKRLFVKVEDLANGAGTKKDGKARLF
jgi:hypothetical protein